MIKLSFLLILVNITHAAEHQTKENILKSKDPHYEFNMLLKNETPLYKNEKEIIIEKQELFKIMSLVDNKWRELYYYCSKIQYKNSLQYKALKKIYISLHRYIYRRNEYAQSYIAEHPETSFFQRKRFYEETLICANLKHSILSLYYKAFFESPQYATNSLKPYQKIIKSIEQPYMWKKYIPHIPNKTPIFPTLENSNPYCDHNPEFLQKILNIIESKCDYKTSYMIN